MPKRCTGNLKPAPFALTPATVASLVSPAAPIGKRVALVPIAPVRLVDQATRREDPTKPSTWASSPEGANANG